MTTSDRFGTGRLFLTDSRLALALLNSTRYWALNRIFGISRQQANLVTFLLTVIAAEAAYTTGRRVLRMPHVSGTDTAVGLLAMREGALSLAGPGTRETPYAGTVLALALLGGVAAPRLRRGAHTLREAEHRVRAQRIRRYTSARSRGG
jgi:hypothetical protein